MRRNTEQLRQSSTSIQESLRLLREVEESGTQSLAMLKAQGEQIRRTRQRLAEVQDEVKEGGTIIRRMTRWSWFF